MVIWSRGSKQAKTKKRVLNEQVSTAVFDEKFQINTQMELDEDGKPTKPKISTLTVASDKAHGLLGKADLDLSLYGDDEFRIHKLPLVNCKYADAFIEVGLKGVPSSKNSSRTPTGAGSLAEADGGLNSSMLTLLEDYEKLKKEKSSMN